MRLIVGLGNVGDEYRYTRHNIGFEVIDALLPSFNTVEIKNPSFRGELHRDGDNFFLKPSTYMNLSGASVTTVKNFFKIEDTIIIHDDLDLPFGALRFKVGGGTGGHNGLKSLDNETREKSLRVRMGIGKPHHKDISKYVLSKFSEDEVRCLDIWIGLARESIINILNSSWEKVASQSSKKSAKEFCQDSEESIHNQILH